jgi:hypothetical protein
MFPGYTAPWLGYPPAAAVPAANPQAPAREAVQPARRPGDDSQPWMGCIRRRSRRLVDGGWNRPARHRTDGTNESCCRRGVSAALRPQCIGMAGDSAADVLAVAGAGVAGQVLPLRWFARRRRTCRNALVIDFCRVDDPRRCRRGVTRPHNPRDHRRHAKSATTTPWSATRLQFRDHRSALCPRRLRTGPSNPRQRRAR